MKLVINTRREVYGPEDVRRTMSVGDLIALLDGYEDDIPVILSFDNGYTFGGITEDEFQETYDDEGDEEDV